MVIKDAGNNTLTQSAFGNFYTYTSREYDPESGLYFYRARYYDASIGKFINRDPAGNIDGPNLYTYCKNNPIHRNDPFGLADVRMRPLDFWGGLLPNTPGAKHWEIFYNDGTHSGYENTNGGEIRPDDPHSNYSDLFTNLDDELLRQAEEQVQGWWNEEQYNIESHNCQGYINAVIKAYSELLKEKKEQQSNGEEQESSSGAECNAH